MVSSLPSLLSSLPLLPNLSDPRNIFLDSAATVRLIGFSAARRNLSLAAAAHAALLKSGLHSNLFVANSLLDAYTKCGDLDLALNLFDRMPLRDVVSWTTIISAHCLNGSAEDAIGVFVDMLSEETAPSPNEFTAAAVSRACGMLTDERMGRMFHGHLVASGFAYDAFVSNSLIDMYAKAGSIVDAERLLGGLSSRDVVSWSTIISGCVLHGMFENALVLFVEMLEEGIEPNIVTMLSIIQACSLLGRPSLFTAVHTCLIKWELHRSIPVAKSLAIMYAKNGFFDEGMKVFHGFFSPNENECFDPDLIAALIHGCTQTGSLDHGKAIHGCVFKMGFLHCTIVENSVIDLYAKHGQIESAHFIFERMEERDTVSWNTMISCLLKNDHADESLDYLSQLHAASGGELMPDFVTIISSIQACSMISSLEKGQILHGLVIKSGFNSDVFVCNALIDMYGKSGWVNSANQIFQEMDVRDLGSWNSIISIYGIHGKGASALKVFKNLRLTQTHKPNAVTFVNVISACGHSGLSSEGFECFKVMQRDYEIEPTIEHYAAVVDLLGRSGKLIEAEKFIEEMPIKPGPSIWGSLLGACVIHRNVEMAKRAAAELSVMEPDSNVWRVALSNVYASAGLWDEAAQVRAEMKREGSRKEPGWSYVVLPGMEQFKFIVGDTRHPETDSIYQVWRNIMEHITDGFVETL
ncbi:pentatricopeptide repeat-containing protein At3g57430, chloroplastic-like [Curcuma longa]|uniref:pentatricopeptide repeat-containing protein At3g57430, chloroplastic-like n=1 Tax=Curcuma longa TaxID=136217 RepID=UPI003D9ED616